METSSDDLEIQPYEKEHDKILRDNSAECTLFLKKNDSFPLSKPCKALLIGSGARDTVKGGTGSGEVDSRFFITCEQGLESAGFEIVSKDWLDKFPTFKKSKRDSFINNVKEEAENVKAQMPLYAWGIIQPEAEYNLPLDEYNADVAIYVLSRICGEGADRRLIKGDVYLTDSEIKDILYLNQKYEKFMLVLNVCGPVDLTPVLEVKNILLLSLLGVVTGDILADIILGKANPSGKLATTWAAVKDYRYIEEFGNIDNTRYLEGLYVGYRYFDSFKVRPLFPFGFGLSYTDFKISKKAFKNKNNEIIIEVEVTNLGKYDGKEAVQVYLSPSQQNKDKPYQSLACFKKTPLLKPNETHSLTLSFKLDDFARYDEQDSKYILDKGNYIIRVGNSSEKSEVYGYILLNEDIVTQKLKNIGGKPDFEPLAPQIEINDDLSKVEKIELTKNDFKYNEMSYNYKGKINEKIKDLSDKDLIKLSIGNYQEKGEKEVVHVVGESGETCSSIKGIDKHLAFVDGPAGVNVIKKYGIDEKGIYRLSNDVFMNDLGDFMSPEEKSKKDIPQNNKDRKGKIYYQYCTAIPIGTALAQSFNEEFLENIGNKIIGEEMDLFKPNLFLAPGLNIHRNILNGRNFEYFSEDPLVSGKMAAAMTRGIQTHKNRCATIKHFACNNQERNRCNNNSILSERTLREIYLKGFKIAVEEGKPHALMTSYNLINGVHSSERRDLLIDVLRCEWGYEGLIISDWYFTGDCPLRISNNPPQKCLNNIKGGNNLQMFGEEAKTIELMKALKDGEISRDNLLENASKVYDIIELLNQ